LHFWGRKLIFFCKICFANLHDFKKNTIFAVGNDLNEWHHSLFNQTGFKTGLEPTSRYIRLYLTCQAEPLFINIGNLVKDYTNGYNVKSSDTVEFIVDIDNSEITAHINIINDNQLEELGI
jgi:hypothetical protein